MESGSEGLHQQHTDGALLAYGDRATWEMRAAILEEGMVGSFVEAYYFVETNVSTSPRQETKACDR